MPSNAEHRLFRWLRSRKPGLPTASLSTLRLFLLACVVMTVGAFVAFAVWRYLDLDEDAHTGLQRNASVAQEHAQRVFDTNESLLQLVLRLTDGASPEQVEGNADALHAELQALTKSRPQIQSIWVFGPDGRALVGSRAARGPAGFNVSGRPYFQWHQASRGGVFASGVMTQEGERFFNISRGRYDRAGRFLGVVTVAIFSSYFSNFHGELAQTEPGLAVALLREDGALYSRWPVLPAMPDRVSEGTVRQLQASSPRGATATVLPALDGTQRLVTFRPLAGYPVWVAVAKDVATVRAAWVREMARTAAFAVLPILLLSYFAYCTVRSTRRSAEVTAQLQQEVTARRQAEEALLQSQKLEALGRLTGGVAHDFNNALMVIAGNLHLLRRGAAAKDERSLNAIGRALESATKLTRQLLAFTRRQPLKPESIVLQDQLPRLADLLKPVLGSGIALAITVDPGTPAVLVDQAELELAVLNLAVNARDAMPEGGSFTLAASADPAASTTRVLVRAADDGEGMDPGVLRRAFDPFFTTKAIGKGTGLGLAQVHSLCARAGGEARIESTRGVGTVVTLALPVAPAGAAQEAAAAGAPNFDKRVLLVEDNADVAQAVARMLEDLGCSVVHCPEGGAAIQYLEKEQAPAPDLLLTDLVMPNGMGGVELSEKVRERWPRIRTMYMTGYSDQLERVASFQDPVLPKPFTASLLTKSLRAALA